MLVIAHHQQPLLDSLLESLDDERMEIFLHVDKKWKDFDEASARSRLRKSALHVISERYDVQWGADSQIWCELALLRAAVRAGTHDYYHLISGVDMPLKTPKEILAFFDAHRGKEFLQFVRPEQMAGIPARYRFWHLLQGRFGRALSPKKNLFLYYANRAFLSLQKMLGVNRVRHETRSFAKGANWFSITRALAEYVLSEEAWIRKTFRMTNCCDEVFLHTLVVNSPFKDSLFHARFEDSHESYMRLIDWSRGGPYTFRMRDLDELTTSPMLFARKFDWNTDSAVVLALRDHLRARR